MNYTITFSEVMQYAGYLIGALIVWQLQRIIVKFNKLITDVELAKQDNENTKEKVHDHEVKFQRVDEKLSTHSDKISRLESKVV